MQPIYSGSGDSAAVLLLLLLLAGLSRAVLLSLFPTPLLVLYLHAFVSFAGLPRAGSAGPRYVHTLLCVLHNVLTFYFHLEFVSLRFVVDVHFSSLFIFAGDDG